MAFTRQQWALDFLHSIGNPHPNRDTVNFVLGWTRAETGGGQGSRFNLLNTTQGAQGATDYNSVGVKNYVSYQQGINANTQTIQNGLYNNLLNALRTNNGPALGAGSGVPTQSILSELSTWCACGYGRGFANSGAQWASDTFTYGSGSTSMQPSPKPSPIQTVLQKGGIGVSAPIAGTIAQGPLAAAQSGVLSQLGGLLDPIRWLKGLLGGLLLIAGIVLALAVLFEKVGSNPSVQTLTGVVKKAGLAG